MDPAETLRLLEDKYIFDHRPATPNQILKAGEDPGDEFPDLEPLYPPTEIDLIIKGEEQPKVIIID